MIPRGTVGGADEAPEDPEQNGTGARRGDCAQERDPGIDRSDRYLREEVAEQREERIAGGVGDPEGGRHGREFTAVDPGDGSGQGP